MDNQKRLQAYAEKKIKKHDERIKYLDEFRNTASGSTLYGYPTAFENQAFQEWKNDFSNHLDELVELGEIQYNFLPTEAAA